MLLVDFYADWCGPCRMLKPVINNLAENYSGRIKIVSVNVDKNRRLSEKYGVKSVPDVRLFNNGVELERISGFKKESFYRSRIEAVLHEAGDGAGKF